MVEHAASCEMCAIVERTLIPVVIQCMAQGLIGYGFDDEKAQYFFDAKAEGAEVAPLIPALLEYIKSVPSFVKKIFKTKTDESLSKGRGFVKGLLLFAARFHKHLLDMTDEVTAGREGRQDLNLRILSPAAFSQRLGEIKGKGSGPSELWSWKPDLLRVKPSCDFIQTTGLGTRKRQQRSHTWHANQASSLGCVLRACISTCVLYGTKE